MDGGFRNITNNIAFELFGSGTATRGVSTAAMVSPSTAVGATIIPISNANQIVAFEVGMTLVSSLTDGAAPSADFVTITGVDRANGIITGTSSVFPLSADWSVTSGAAGYLSVMGDIPATGALSTGSFLALSGLAAWLPVTTPSNVDNFWGVNRSADPTRLAGLRYNAQAYTIEEGMTNALAFANREGAKPDMCIMDFASYAALVNALGAKVQYVQVKHDEVEVAFDGITFQSAYGKITVLADRSCPPQTAYVLTINTWKLRSLGKVPHILTYGMEGLEGLRVGNADALEIRIGYYGNLICSAPGWNMVVQLSA